MSQPPPTAMPYETPTADEFFWWRVIRVAVIAWALLILTRHGLWYGGELGGNFNITAAVFAGLEGIILLFVLAWAIALKTPRTRGVLGLAGLCGLWIVVNAIAFLVPAMFTWSSDASLHTAWQFVRTIQLWVVPGMMILGASRMSRA
jgi:hypothetical protein